ncbi:MAG: hypothetical protein CSA07_00640 [Bacteroidia bacterium]|nr:MAG: hypothetical protein CSA07_00640 [Bacteroidia bacterium]
MKRILPVLALLPLLALALLPATAWAKAPQIEVTPDTIKMGQIQIKELHEGTGNVAFTVHNSGDAPLILQSVSGCCGTEIKSYPKGPILPGKTGEIKVFFRIEPKPQAISRVVTILSNDPKRKEIQHKIFGTVIKDREKNRLF